MHKIDCNNICSISVSSRLRVARCSHFRSRVSRLGNMYVFTLDREIPRVKSYLTDKMSDYVYNGSQICGDAIYKIIKYKNYITIYKNYKSISKQIGLNSLKKCLTKKVSSFHRNAISYENASSIRKDT